MPHFCSGEFLSTISKILSLQNMGFYRIRLQKNQIYIIESYAQFFYLHLVMRVYTYLRLFNKCYLNFVCLTGSLPFITPWCNVGAPT
jgi:hypothetical protein